MITRQKVLYYTIYKQKELLHIALLQILFMLKQESHTKLNTFYDFLPYNSNPFSFQLNEDLLYFSSLNLISNTKKLKINNDNIDRNIFPSYEIQIMIDNFLNKLLNNRGNYLNDAYMKDILITHPITSPKIYSLGYEGLSVDAYFNILLQKNINILIDVRNNPYSRKFGFSSNILKDICTKLNIEYYHFPQLGIPSNLRKNLTNQESYLELFKAYTATVIPKEQNTISLVNDIIKDKRSVFMCFEKDYKMCHRSYLLDNINISIPIKHL